MEFDYNARQAFRAARVNEWKEAHGEQEKNLPAELATLAQEIDKKAIDTYDRLLECEAFWKEHQSGECFSEFMRKNCKPLVELYVPEKYREDYYAMVDEIPTFQYATGYTRRSVRTRAGVVHMTHVFGLLCSYRAFSMYGVSTADYICDRMTADALDFKRNAAWQEMYIRYADDIWAARINAGDTEVVDAVRDAFLSENNTTIVTVDLVRAVIKCKDQELHRLLADFLAAARLSEGIRQVVCENADCGRMDAFLTILHTIDEQKLLRFSAVKRAVATWTGICDESNMDRISDKLFTLILQAVDDEKAAREMTDTEDSMQIVTGLWAMGAYEMEHAVARVKELVQTGSRQQILAASYFARSLQELEQDTAEFVMEHYRDDMEIAAAYMPIYLEYCDMVARASFEVVKGVGYGEGMIDAEYEYEAVPLSELFDSEEKARLHYGILKEMLAKIPKRELTFSPCVFPWYGVSISKSDLISRMAAIAYVLQDDVLIDEICGILSEIGVGDLYGNRGDYVRMLLHAPKTEKQRQALISYVADKESFTRPTAYSLVRHMTLTKEEYVQLEGYLKYKNGDIRRYTLALLGMQESDGIMESAGRLLASASEPMRLAGFDLLKQLCEADADQKEACATFVRQAVADESSLSDKEKILYDEICKEDGASGVLNEEGYGLYHPGKLTDIPTDAIAADTDAAEHAEAVKAYFNVEKAELDRVILAIDDVFRAHAKDEYKKCDGETVILGNGLFLLNYDIGAISDKYPFKELWQDLYDEHIKDEQLFWNVRLALEIGYTEEKIADVKAYQAEEDRLFLACGTPYMEPKLSYAQPRDIVAVLDIIADAKGLKLPFDVCADACLFAAKLSEGKRWYAPAKPENSFMRYDPDEKKAFIKSMKLARFVGRVCHYENDEEFMRAFWILRALDQTYRFQKRANAKNSRYNNRRENYLSALDFVKACQLGMISENEVYRYIFEEYGVRLAVDELSDFTRENIGRRLLELRFRWYMPVNLEEGTLDREHPFFRLGRKISETLTEKILDVELKRGDTPTVFSAAVCKIICVTGIDRLFQILTALGNDPLDRNTYYSYSGGIGKRECLCHLLQVCFPAPEDTGERFAAYVKQYQIKDTRLVEIAMYSPQWLDLAEAYIGCDGFKSGCYYFMAHMNEHFDDKKMAMIAKYTPLTSEELNDGCFDVDWFFEAYHRLGGKMFDKLYKAAKYISDGAKHTRARKYADAALGKVNRGELEQTIKDKRNKDLLMSYGLIPIKDKADELHRYEFMQEFLKEGRQFGAMRRTSEATAVSCALKNLARVAGYADDMRLVLAMETELVSANAAYFEGVTEGEFTLSVKLADAGKTAVIISKAGKTLKTVPTALKKNKTYLAVREFADKLKKQYSRCVKMFENSMENREIYTAGELKSLMQNPVVAGILESLLFAEMDSHLEDGGHAEDSGNIEIEDSGDTEAESGVVNILSMEQLLESGEGDRKVRVAHPADLYKSGEWEKWQRYFFDRQQDTGKKQPFKQVFRELYTKLSEETDAYDSRMFAGNQIQPKKTLGALKARGWVADYENGLQKIYYKDNIIATIYALADWFSPADTEAPTLEYVSFYDRKTFRPKKLSEIPDIVYSEVMRDVDLAVSVAHAGGVDPETSHSTIEMRKVIFAFNVQLFQLSNVRFEGTHAYVDGTHGKYSVHLGSGVVHKIGSHMINILPVHSQGRGKIFLPFVDDDPKTAEIMSKILLLAEDNKIKDPYIMGQIVEG